MAESIAHVRRSLNGLLFTKVTILLIFALSVGATLSHCPTGFANFGDSLTDTGNALSLFPYFYDADFPPYGETFFGGPSKRFSNGRLVPDFFSLAFRKPFLDPYIKATSFEYNFGINFAEVGATANVQPIPPVNPVAVYPFQLNQFKRFFNSVVTTESEPPCTNFFVSLPLPFGSSCHWVSHWLYTIEIGGNDLINAIRAGAPNPNFTQIQQTVIPLAVEGIIQTIRELYTVGARKFLVFGIPAQGCATIFLTLFPPTVPKDNLGCIIPINDLCLAFKQALLAQIITLRGQLSGANIAFFDYYAANVELIAKPLAYGFTEPFRACCGAPGVGTLNYNPNVTCGRPGSNNCANPEQYVNWDGIHFTDAYYRVISTFALNGLFTDKGINYARKCRLDFTRFPSTFTFNQTYPSVCQTILV